MDLKSKIILISGPTASGKSSFAIKFAKKVKDKGQPLYLTIINNNNQRRYLGVKLK